MFAALLVIWALLFYMNVLKVIHTLNFLIEKQSYKQALLLANEYAHYKEYFLFNDAYATLLYCNDNYLKAQKVINYNLRLLAQKTYNSKHYLSCYFLKTLCYYAQGNVKKAQYYKQKCVQLSTANPVLKGNLQNIFND